MVTDSRRSVRPTSLANGIQLGCASSVIEPVKSEKVQLNADVVTQNIDITLGGYPNTFTPGKLQSRLSSLHSGEKRRIQSLQASRRYWRHENNCTCQRF